MTLNKDVKKEMDGIVINYDINQALIRISSDIKKLEEVMTNCSFDERWKLAYKYPFKDNIETISKEVQEWANEHYVEEEDETFNELGTVSGRFSSDKPNISGVPKEGEEK